MVCVQAILAGIVAAEVQDGKTGRSCRVNFLSVGKIVVLPLHFKIESVLLVFPAGPLALRPAVGHLYMELYDSPFLNLLHI